MVVGSRMKVRQVRAYRGVDRRESIGDLDELDYTVNRKRLTTKRGGCLVGSARHLASSMSYVQDSEDRHFVFELKLFNPCVATLRRVMRSSVPPS